MKFVYGGVEYPHVISSPSVDCGYEELIVIIPEPTGDYFLSKITSMGGYELLDELAHDEVEIVLDEKTAPETDRCGGVSARIFTPGGNNI